MFGDAATMRGCVDYIKYFQQNDLVGNAAMTDVKGDRSLRPHQQADPDLYLHVVEKRADGIVVRGAKAHNTAAPYAHELIVLPTRDMREEDADYAVAFAIQADAPGITMVCRGAAPSAKHEMAAPVSSRYASVESLTIFRQCVRALGAGLYVRRVAAGRVPGRDLCHLPPPLLLRLQAGHHRHAAGRGGAGGGVQRHREGASRARTS